MTIQRLSHIGLCVSNLDKSYAFYTKVFGFKELSRLPVSGEQADKLLDLQQTDFDAVYLERNGTRIELLYFRSPDPIEQTQLRPLNLVGLTHLSFRVEDIAATMAAVTEAGGQCLNNTLISNPEYQMKGAFITDPDGMRIELLELPGDVNLLPGM